MWNPFRKTQYSPCYRKTMEEHLGRPLCLGEIVHHKNGIRSDNQIWNLKLTNRSWHTQQHIIDNWLKRIVNPKINSIDQSISILTKRMNELEQENEELRNSLEKLSDWMEKNCPIVKEIIAKNEESR